MASRRLGLTSSLSSSTLSSHSPPYHPAPHPSPLLSPTSLQFLSSSVPSSKGQRRSRKLLAEKQELKRIMDPSYLGSFSRSYCHPDPEGRWHDIDYRHFARIKPENEVTRSFTSLRSYSSCHPGPLQPTCITGSKSRITPDPLAYWETFTVPTISVASSNLSDGHDEEEEEVTSEYEYYSTLRNRSFCRSPSPSSEISYSYIAGPIEHADDERRVLKKKKKTNVKGGARGSDGAVDSLCPDESPAPPSLEENEEKEEMTRREPGEEFEPVSRSTLKSSKTEKMHEAWVTMSFIARLKVIRAQRWLRKRVTSCP